MQPYVQHMEQALLSIRPAQWQVQQVIVLDWMDGPREGFCALKEPFCCFYFRLFASTWYSDEKLFVVHAASQEVFISLKATLQSLGPISTPVWMPRWLFQNDTLRWQAEQEIENMITMTQEVPLLLTSINMIDFISCWRRENV